jgi:hypothetical protein
MMVSQSIQGHAGLELAYALSYFLARDVQRPVSLRQLVWPDLDRWLPDATRPNLAAGTFLELLDRLRDVFPSPLVFAALLYFPFTIPFTRTSS